MGFLGFNGQKLSKDQPIKVDWMALPSRAPEEKPDEGGVLSDRVEMEAAG